MNVHTHFNKNQKGFYRKVDACTYLLYKYEWFSKCGSRTSSGTQRNLWIKYKLGRVSTKAVFFPRG